MPPFSKTTTRAATTARDGVDSTANLIEDVLTPRSNPNTPTGANLARGIVWADILADIAADQESSERTRG